MLRASSYNIYVDLPDSQMEMLLVHGYTGAFDRVSRRVATYIRSLETTKPPRPLYGKWTPEPPISGEVIIPSEQVIELLKKRGYLTEMDPEGEEQFFSSIARTLHNKLNKPQYLLMPTYNCNLRCSYCFQDHMRTKPEYGHLLRLMKRELVDRIFVAMDKIDVYQGVQQVPVPERSIGFFGGEPLLAQNRPIIEYIMDKGQKSKETSFWAVTNGTDLNAYTDLLGPKRLARLQITLDGPPAEHDKRRIYADGQGSFERIARHITMALDLGVQINVRLNIDRNNILQLPELSEEIMKRSWHLYPTFSVYTAPIVASNEKTDIKTTFSSWGLNKALMELQERYPSMKVIERPADRIKSQAYKIFNMHEEPAHQPVFCGAHAGMYIFDAFGDIYACWERTGDTKVRIGYVTDDGDFSLEETLYNKWRSRNVTTNTICRKCRYALHCGGGCAVYAEIHRGDFFTNYCDGYGARFRAGVAEAYLDYLAGAVVTEKEGMLCDL